MKLSRIALGMALWAAPGSIALASLLLLANRSAFRSGPGVPTAGTSEAWGLLWLGVAVVTLGFAVGVIANVSWVARALVRGDRVSVGAWLRAAVAVALGATWFGWLLSP